MAARSQSHAALGQAVREQRKRQGLTQEALARASGLPATYISDVERGVRNPSWSTIVTLAQALGVKPSQLAQRAEKGGG